MISEKHEVLLRMRAIELLALWEGRVITNHIVEWFGVSRQQASIDIKRYINDRNPNSMVYRPGEKGYIPREDFKPVLTGGHVNEYLELISGVANKPLAVALEANAYFTAVQLPDRSISPDVLREVIKASRSNLTINFTYCSMNNPAPHRRVISPHTIIYSGFRWHVRGYCHVRNDFRDFILSRITEPKLSKDDYVDSSSDRVWNEKITLTIEANRQLSAAQRALIERDFGMEDGELRITVRKALVHYTLQRLQAGITDKDESETLRFPIMISHQCRCDLKNVFFGED